MKNKLNNNERRILDVFASVIPKLNALEKERALGYVEGMSAIKSMLEEQSNEKEMQ